VKTQSLQRRKGGVEARKSGDSGVRVGQAVTLRNGQQGKVQFVSATMQCARVSMGDGKTVRTVKLTEIAPADDGLDMALPSRSRRALQDIDPEEGFDEQEEFACEPEEDCATGGHGDGEVEYVPPDDEHDEMEEYADGQGGRGDDLHGHSHDGDHDGHLKAGDFSDRGDEHETAEEERKPEIRRTMERARPVAGQRPMVSDRVTARAERSLEGPPKPVMRKDLEKVGKKDRESGRPIMQPSDSIRENERRAAQAAPELETRLSRVAAGVPGAKFVRLRPQKNPERLREKVRGEDKPPETISDYLASQISAGSVEAKDQVIAGLKKCFKVVEIEDSFLKGRKEKAGYPSANVQVMLLNGATAEVQIVPREVQQMTEQSHHFYKMGRNARDAGKTALSRHYFDQAQAINERALARFRLRNGIKGS
jgi:hypothetical protein